jgi:hypothetical protein
MLNPFSTVLGADPAAELGGVLPLDRNPWMAYQPPGTSTRPFPSAFAAGGVDRRSRRLWRGTCNYRRRRTHTMGQGLWKARRKIGEALAGLAKAVKR